MFVFKAIFGDDSIITFERTSPAYLTINIQATSTELFNFLARTITEIEGEKVIEDDDVLTADEADELVFGLQLGITDFYEVQSILNSLNPAGIFLEVNFSLF
ncbi:MAG: hypothetical protein LBF97_04410 [Elusimicrobiota bacterium]|nr:hypothetical protein [Elusimicrobiota bacterium]